MSTKVSVSMSQESITPEYDSVAVHCALEFDAEPSQGQDIAIFERELVSAVAICRQVLGAEVVRHTWMSLAAS